MFIVLKCMKNKQSINSNLNKIFQKIVLNRRYSKSLKNKFRLLINDKNEYCTILKFNKLNNNFVVSHIINISFSSINTVLNISKFSGRPNYFLTAGQLSLKGKQKRFRSIVLKSIKNLLARKSKLL